MTADIAARDLSVIETDEAGSRWLTALQEHLVTSDLVVRLGEAGEAEDDWVISRDPQGAWRAGRYVGDISFRGRRLTIAPRLGAKVIERWLEGALNLVAVPETSARQRSESFIALLMAAVWCRTIGDASRHGPPAFRADRWHEGLFVRGRLDVRETARLRARGSAHVASVSRYRELDNAVSRSIVAADRVLRHRIGHDRWRTDRAREVVAQLVPVVGARPTLPREGELRRIRYTPISRPFRAAADLSWRIAQHEGLSAESAKGQADGLLLDVAELWELFLLNCVRLAVPGCIVEHGTTMAEATHLLRSTVSEFGMGRLKPDIVVRSPGGDVLAVIDAKYKRLADAWPDRPAGVDRADLYQLTSYLSRLDPDGTRVGMLLYPQWDDASAATAETLGPWRAETGSEVRFERVAVAPDEAVAWLRTTLAESTAAASAA